MKPISIRGKPTAYPLICAPLVGADHHAVLEEAQAAVKVQADIVEWRIDFFRNFQTLIRTGGALREILSGIPLLLTCRSVAEGGQRVPITEKQVVELYAEACAAGFADLVDYEMRNAEADIKAVREASRRHGVGMVCSFHDFERTPPLPELGRHFRRAQDLGGDVAKVAVMARSSEDVLTLLAATQQAAQALEVPLIGISMGPHGALSRTIGFAFGSALTFGVATAGSAPGQMPIGELRTAIEIARKALGG